MNPKDRLIVALDVESQAAAIKIVEALKKEVRFFKIGLELFSSNGPKIVSIVKDKGCEVFLDLKLHDIPNTVGKTAALLTRSGVYMFNVHALGGYDMMKAASDAVKKEAARLKIEKPKVLAVTVLTSMDENSLKKIGINDNIEKSALKLASLAKDAALDGIVASALEARSIRENMGKDFLIVTPGIRPLWADQNDQKRTATPIEAIANGADYIVIGRPITEARNPLEAAREILKEIAG